MGDDQGLLIVCQRNIWSYFAPLRLEWSSKGEWNIVTTELWSCAQCHDGFPKSRKPFMLARRAESQGVDAVTHGHIRKRSFIVAIYDFIYDWLQMFHMNKDRRSSIWMQKRSTLPWLGWEWIKIQMDVMYSDLTHALESCKRVLEKCVPSYAPRGITCVPDCGQCSLWLEGNVPTADATG